MDLRVRGHNVVRCVGLTTASLRCRRRGRRSCVTNVTVVFGGGGGMVGPRAVCHSGTAPPLRHRSQGPRDLHKHRLNIIIFPYYSCNKNIIFQKIKYKPASDTCIVHVRAQFDIIISIIDATVTLYHYRGNSCFTVYRTPTTGIVR